MLESDQEMSESSSMSSGTPYSSPSQEVPEVAMPRENGSNTNILSLHGKPKLRITIQPQDVRFRYKTERESGTHGCIQGVASARDGPKTYPTVELMNYNEKANITCTLVHKDADEEHPHNLRDDQHEDLSISAVVPAEGHYTVCFPGLGIIQRRKKAISAWLYQKYQDNVWENPCRTDQELLAHCKALEKQIDSNIVRLKFSAKNENNVDICKPVFSRPIRNLKNVATNQLVIMHNTILRGNPRGGDEMVFLTSKVSKTNIGVRFYELHEEDEDDHYAPAVWEAFVTIMQHQVHHQCAIRFSTPPYKDQYITKEVKVYMQLVRPKDGAKSESREFTYVPERYSQQRKRCRRDDTPTEAPVQSPVSGTSSTSRNSDPRACPQVQILSDTAIQTNRGTTPNTGNTSGLPQKDNNDETKCTKEPVMFPHTVLPRNVIIGGPGTLMSQETSMGFRDGVAYNFQNEAQTNLNGEQQQSFEPGISFWSQKDVEAFPITISAPNTQYIPNDALPASTQSNIGGFDPAITVDTGYTISQENINQSHQDGIEFMMFDSTVSTASVLSTPMEESPQCAPLEFDLQQIQHLTDQHSQTDAQYQNLDDNTVGQMSSAAAENVVGSDPLLSQSGPAHEALKVVRKSVTESVIDFDFDVNDECFLDYYIQLENIRDENVKLMPDSGRGPGSSKCLLQGNRRDKKRSNLNTVRVSKLLKAIIKMFKENREENKEMIRNNFDDIFDLRFQNGDTFLHMTLQSNLQSFEATVRIIDAVNMNHLLNLANDSHQNVLHLACAMNLPRIVTFLVEKGCSPMARDEEGNTAIHVAAMYQTCLEALLDAMDRNSVEYDLDANNLDRETALHVAASRGCALAVRQLLSRGASCGGGGGGSDQPLHLAARHAQHDAMRALLGYCQPAELDAVDGRGWTALQIACSNEVTDDTLAVIRLLLEHGANPTTHKVGTPVVVQIASRETKMRAIFEEFSVIMPEDCLSSSEDEFESADEGESDEDVTTRLEHLKIDSA